MEKLNINYVSIEWSVSVNCCKIHNTNVMLLLEILKIAKKKKHQALRFLTISHYALKMRSDI